MLSPVSLPSFDYKSACQKVSVRSPNAGHFLAPTHIVPCHKIPHLSYTVTINLDRLCRSIEGKEPAE